MPLSSLFSLGEERGRAYVDAAAIEEILPLHICPTKCARINHCPPACIVKMKNKIYQSPTITIEGRPEGYSSFEKTMNLQEEKESFLKTGTTPMFLHHSNGRKRQLPGESTQIRFDLLGEAEHILLKVNQIYGSGEAFLNHIFGPFISQEEANKILMDYIKDNSLQESLSVYWSNNLTCSARMVWRGYPMRFNKPELREYSLWINGSNENPFLRRKGIVCLLDHEIGTHFLRAYNDGLQPWYSYRNRFGLRGLNTRESACSEEGLASINTALRSSEPYLWLNALKYYATCKSTEMNFTQLFDHLGLFMENPGQRWKIVMRIKRGLKDPDELGGYGGDQCYFEGAVNILRNLDAIDFTLLMSGKICYDEVMRVRRVARKGFIKLPAFMQNLELYNNQLKKMAVLNGLNMPHPRYCAPMVYCQRLLQKERERENAACQKVSMECTLQANLSDESHLSSTRFQLHSSPSSLEAVTSDSIYSLDAWEKKRVDDMDKSVTSVLEQVSCFSQGADSKEENKPTENPDLQLTDHKPALISLETKTTQQIILRVVTVPHCHSRCCPQKKSAAMPGTKHHKKSVHSSVNSTLRCGSATAGFSFSNKGVESSRTQKLQCSDEELVGSLHSEKTITSPRNASCNQDLLSFSGVKDEVPQELMSSTKPPLLKKHHSSSLAASSVPRLDLAACVSCEASSSCNFPMKMRGKRKPEVTKIVHGEKRNCLPAPLNEGGETSRNFHKQRSNDYANVHGARFPFRGRTVTSSLRSRPQTTR